MGPRSKMTVTECPLSDEARCLAMRHCQPVEVTSLALDQAMRHRDMSRDVVLNRIATDVSQ